MFLWLIAPMHMNHPCLPNPLNSCYHMPLIRINFQAMSTILAPCPSPPHHTHLLHLYTYTCTFQHLFMNFIFICFSLLFILWWWWLVRVCVWGGGGGRCSPTFLYLFQIFGRNYFICGPSYLFYFYIFRNLDKNSGAMASPP